MSSYHQVNIIISDESTISSWFARAHWLSWYTI